MTRLLDFSGRVVIVTGAGQGLGRAYAELIAARGAAVVVNDLGVGPHGGPDSESLAAEVTEAIQSTGGQACANTDTVASELGAEAIVAAAIRAFGRLDAVVNNAGILDRQRFPAVNLRELEDQLAVHLGGAFNMARAAWDHLAESGKGRVVMTSSPAGIYGGATETAYGAAKSAVIGLTRSLAVVGRQRGIKVNAISPGGFTRMTLAGAADDTFKEFTRKYRTAEQIAPLAAVLVHPECPVSGRVFAASGGRVAEIITAETRGYFNATLTPENILSHWSEIIDDAGSFVPRDTAESLEFGLKRLKDEGIPVPETSLDAFRSTPSD